MDTTTFLDKAGGIITRESLTVPGRTIKWGDLEIVSIARAQGVSIQPILHLVLSSKTDPRPVSVSETEDVGLMEGVHQAINRVAQTRRAKRE